MSAADFGLGAPSLCSRSRISQALLFYTNALTEDDAKLQQAACVALKHLRVSSACPCRRWRSLLVVNVQVSSFPNHAHRDQSRSLKSWSWRAAAGPPALPAEAPAVAAASPQGASALALRERAGAPGTQFGTLGLSTLISEFF